VARHFLQLYLLIVATVAAASWAQGQLWETFDGRSEETAIAESRAQAAALNIVNEQLGAIPQDDRRQYVAKVAARSGVKLELLEPGDIVGEDTLSRLSQGEIAHMRAADEDWLLKRVTDDDRVLAFRYSTPDVARSVLDWTLAILFYAAIALVIMAWLWPLTRDLRQLERSTTSFGDRAWKFDAGIGVRSPVYRLAEAFRRMAARIDSLISAQKDMTNAMSHEIKTPLARMRFEIEMARTAADPQRLATHLSHLDSDVAELDTFIKAMLDYAILDRAEVALNVHEHDMTLVLPAVVETFRRSGDGALVIRCEVSPAATRVRCDAHLMETVVRNLLYNAVRYAQGEIHVMFSVLRDGQYRLSVEDDGPGIPEADRERVFDSFVQLDEPSRRKSGYGLGLAIVKRIVEWHGGKVTVYQCGLRGAGFAVTWADDQRNRAGSASLNG
jgi:two-component system, OmpR family, sensor kinase